MNLKPVIAQKPATPRDSSKLLVYNTKTNEIIIDRFLHLDCYLPNNSFLVLNKTKVIPSRVWLKKQTGGRVEVLFLLNEKTDKESETKRVFNKLEQKGIKRLYLTLHVGLGTFAPVTEMNLKTGKLHKEYYKIEKEVFNGILASKSKGQRLVAVGTTVVRALESFDSSRYKTGFVQDRSTDLFIFPPYNFKMIDHLITNFHLPGSSLLMLVDAFLKFKRAKRSLNEIYEFAIKKDLRFYSFGDVMLIL